MGNPNEAKIQTVELANDRDIELVVGHQQRRRRSCAARAVRFVLTLLLAFFLVKTVATAAFRAGLLPHKCGRHGDSEGFVASMLEDGDGEQTVCFSGHGTPNPEYDPVDEHDPHFRYADKFNFTVPATADGLYAFSKGPLAFGFVSFETAEPKNDVEIDVLVEYNYNSTAHVCALKRKDNSYGLGIFTRSPHKRRHGGHHGRRPHRPPQVKVSMVVKLPANAESPLNIKSLRTILPMFRHDIKDLQNAVRFKKLELHGANFPISSESVDAETLVLTTSNAPIRGTFNASESLVLTTVNAPIEATVSLLSAAGQPNDRPSRLVMHTKNAHVRADVALGTPLGSPNAGSYRVDAVTLNAPLNVTITSAPALSLLRLDGRTANAPVDVTLHSTYEGEFRVAGTIFPPTINDLDPKDPTGEDRKRTLTFSSVVRTVAVGEVYWGNHTDESPKGHVNLATANAPSRLSL